MGRQLFSSYFSVFYTIQLENCGAMTTGSDVWPTTLKNQVANLIFSGWARPMIGLGNTNVPKLIPYGQPYQGNENPEWNENFVVNDGSPLPWWTPGPTCLPGP